MKHEKLALDAATQACRAVVCTWGREGFSSRSNAERLARRSQKERELAVREWPERVRDGRLVMLTVRPSRDLENLEQYMTQHGQAPRVCQRTGALTLRAPRVYRR